jgi:hypothetical protein
MRGGRYGLCGPHAKDPKPAGCFTGPVLCQHGPNECTANLIEACVVNLYPERFWCGTAPVFAPVFFCNTIICQDRL